MPPRAVNRGGLNRGGPANRGGPTSAANRGGPPTTTNRGGPGLTTATNRGGLATAVNRGSRGQNTGRGGRGSGRGGRGNPRGHGGLQSGAPAVPQNDLLPADAVNAVGVKRSEYGTFGKAIQVKVNAYGLTIPDGMIHHYDVVITPDKKSSKLNFDLIKILQNQEPDIFTPKAVYDGRKNLFAYRRLPLGNNDARQFTIALPSSNPNRQPSLTTVQLVKVTEINPEALHRFLYGQQTYTTEIQTTLTAANSVNRMSLIMEYPFNSRSFYTDKDILEVGSGLQLWRGFFLSARPAIGRMILNIDISTGMFYKPGPLLNLCLEVLGKNHPDALDPNRGFGQRDRVDLQRFLSGVRVNSDVQAGQHQRSYTISGLTTESAMNLTFSNQNGQQMTVAQYFAQTNRVLRFPNIVCIKTRSNALIPIEKFTVLRGQIARKEIPATIRDQFAKFSTKKPQERLESIQNGIQTLKLGQSDYVRDFGMSVDTRGPLSVEARVIPAPALMYGNASKEPRAMPRFGAWNLVDKKFIQPSIIKHWMVIIYETPTRFGMDAVGRLIRDFKSACNAVGMTFQSPDVEPLARHCHGQGKIVEDLHKACMDCKRQKGGAPHLILVVLPDGGHDIYRVVKHFGDTGFATQCMIASKCKQAKPQYWANILLKVNAKLGGINWTHQHPALTDPHNPAIIMGADVMHPAPGQTTVPSFAALVASVDKDATRYIAVDRVQGSRQEIIQDLKNMCKDVLNKYMDYRQQKEKLSKASSEPQHGVSEGQFKDVLDKEVALIKEACKELNINPKITFIVVGKRHHIRFFPDEKDADRSGNCPAGTLVEKSIGHPVEFDFYLQSHAGLLGTSRSAHYSVLYDQNQFKPDSIQSLSYALCHVFARSTRSVSIPAPVYYADIVCTKAKTRFNPAGSSQVSDVGTEDSTTLELYTKAFEPLHQDHSRRMYFM